MGKRFSEKLMILATPPAFSFIYSLLLLILLNVTSGTYFEDSEIVPNQIIQGHFAAQFDWGMSLNNVHFGVLPLYSILSHTFENVSVLSWVHSAYIFCFLFPVFWALLLMMREKKLTRAIQAVVLLVSSLILLDNILSVNNVRSSMLIAFGSLLWLSLAGRGDRNVKHYVLATLLFLIALIVRLEITIIGMFVGLLFFLLFGERRKILITLIFLMVSAGTFLAYRYALTEHFPEEELMHKAEHEFYDRENLHIDRSTPEKAIVDQAMMLFIVDSTVYTAKDYEAKLSEVKIVDYLGNYWQLKKVFSANVTEMWSSIRDYIWLLLLSLFSAVFLGAYHLRDKKMSTLQKLKILSFSLAFLLLPLFMSIFLIIPGRFLVPYLSIINIMALLYIIVRNGDDMHIRRYLIPALIILLALLPVFLVQKLKNQHRQMEDALRFERVMREISQEGKNGVIANFRGWGLYPAKLFHSTHGNSTDHYYLDMYFFNRYKLYKDHNRPFFGKGLGSLKERMLRCANDENVIFFSDEDYNNFLKDYLRLIHDMEVRFIRNDYYDSEMYQSYFIETDRH